MLSRTRSSSRQTLAYGVCAAALGFALLLPGQALAEDEDAREARIAALEAKLEELTQQLQDLKETSSANVQQVRETQEATTVTLANARPTIATGDGQFSASIRGVFQLDAAIYDQASPGPLGVDFRRGSFGDATENDRARDLGDGANFRRARLGIEGKAFGVFDYNFLYDFGGSGNEEPGKISAAWVQYNVPGTPLRIRGGAFSPPSGIEEATSTNGSLFAERASPSELVRSIGSGDGRTALGLFANGDRWNASAALSGNVIGTQTFDEQLAFVGRFTFLPLKGYDWLVHVGANTELVLEPPKSGPGVPGVTSPLRLRDRPELRVDGTRLVDTGNIDADGLQSYGLEFAAQRQNLHLQAEYYDITVERRASLLPDPHFSGWYVQAGWTITGEPRRYSIATATFDAPKVDKPFDPSKDQWGVWELGLRYSALDLNYREGAPGTASPFGAVRGGEQDIFTVSLNWYPNSLLRFQASFQDVSVDRLSPGGTAFGAGAATPPAGAQVGQDLQIFNLRTQVAF